MDTVKPENSGVEVEYPYSDGQPITFLSLRELNLAEWAVKETLRLHPPLFMLLRRCEEDFHYDGYVLPRGSFLVTSPSVSANVLPCSMTSSF